MPAEHDAQLSVACEHCGTSALQRDGELLRCVCGSLLARYIEGGIELKCRRCKRTVTIAGEGGVESDPA